VLRMLSRTPLLLESAQNIISVLLPESARAVIDSGALGHLVTGIRDESPQVAIVWVGMWRRS